MVDVYIQGGLRTPIGLFQKQYASMRPEYLGAGILNALKKRYPECHIDDIICGNAVGTGGNIGRLTGLLSDYSETVPATTIDMQCASASAALGFAFAKIRAGLSENIIAGGIESSSLQPLRTYADKDDRTGSYYVAQFSPDSTDSLAMIRGAERVSQKYQVTQKELYQWTLKSHAKAQKALETGALSPIILEMPGKKDEGIRPKISEKLLSRIPPILGPDSLTSAANSCLTHDGAAFLLLSHQVGEFKICDMAQVAGDPRFSPELVYKATIKLLKKVNLSMSDIDAIEWNEAFSVIDCIFQRHFPEAVNRYNLFGGALAYGHPYGCSGAINLLHVMQALRLQKGRYGLCAIAGAGGVGISFLIERVGV